MGLEGKKAVIGAGGSAHLRPVLIRRGMSSSACPCWQRDDQSHHDGETNNDGQADDNGLESRANSNGVENCRKESHAQNRSENYQRTQHNFQVAGHLPLLYRLGEVTNDKDTYEG